MTEQQLRFAGYAFLAVAYAALAGGLYFIGANTLFWIRAEAADGRVVGHDRMETPGILRPPGTVPARATVVAFQTANGEDVVAVTDWGSGIDVYSLNDDVTVLYKAEDPTEAKIRGFMSLYLGPLLMMVLGGGFWLAGQLVQILGSVGTPR